MDIRRALTIITTASLLWGIGSAPTATAQTPAGSHLEVLSSDDRGIVLELTVSDFQIETVEHADQTYHRLVIPGTLQTDTAGEPQVPTRGTLLGLPHITGVSVQVLEADYETLRGYRLPPGPSVEITMDSLDAADKELRLDSGDFQLDFAPNREFYATDAFYPGHPVKLGETGYLRDQAVAQVQFYPVQYNPVTGEMRLYRHVRARVTWDAPLSLTATEARGVSPAFEQVMQNTILNYDTLNRPAVPDSTSPSESIDTTPYSQLPASHLSAASSSSDTLKIGVTEDGLYQLTRSDLTGAGFDLSGVDPRTIKISNRGTEVPIYVEGESDGAFDSNDTVLFYGTTITDIYTVENVYWLTAGGSNGQRMDIWDGTPTGSATVPSDFPITLHAEEDTVYWLMPDGDGQEDHWFWGERISPATSGLPMYQEYTLTLDHISTGISTATVRVRLKGFTKLNHRTKIYLNGHEIDDQSWSGPSVYDHEVTDVSHSYLQNGSNIVRVEAVDSGDALPHQAFVNWIEIEYWDTYVAEDDELLFGAPTTGTFQFEVTGFGGNDVQVFDVTDPANTSIITGTALLADGGSYKLQFEDTAQPQARYLALASAQRKSPVSIALDQPSAWKDAGNGADYIIITYKDFYTNTLELASHRSAAGLRVATVRIEDIYDEFNYGVLNPQAIRDFLSYAYDNWVKPAPTYVLLVSGATYDYRDLHHLGLVNYVPTHLTVTEGLGEAASDNWFVTVSGADILPDMFIGRLTAQTATEVEDMVGKIIAYEQNPPGHSWNTDVLLVADDDESSFESISEALADRLPHYYTANTVYVGDYTGGNPTADITSHINDGSILVNYAGHGNVDMWGVWAGGHIFDRSPDVTSLDNVHRLPVVSTANCLNGFFAWNNISMAEEFLRLKDRGAVAVWAPSGLGYPAGHRLLLSEFYDAIFQDDVYALGVATTAAKIAMYDQQSSWSELIQTFVLFGDPATQVGIPTNYPYVESTTPIDGAKDVPLDQDIHIVFSKPISPTTVSLSGPGTVGLVFTPTWQAENTVLSYAHTDFDYNQTLTFTISGQDKLGNGLGSGPVPSTWSFTTPFAPSQVPISGPATGAVNAMYTFGAAVSPSIATQPINYTWEATDQTPVVNPGLGLNDTVSFDWSTPGAKTITVTASNAVGMATDTHEITIYIPPSGVEVTGPTEGAIDTIYSFDAAVSTSTTSQPLSYIWEATGQSSVTHSGADLDDTASFSWSTPGTKTITVTASNPGGTVAATHSIDVKAPPAGVTIAGRATGVVQVDYAFDAAVGPINATPPFTNSWEATDQPPVTRIVGGLNDSASFNWDAPGEKTITVTVANDVGAATNTHEVTLDYSPPTGVGLTGPTKTAVDTDYTFYAATGPITATRPLTYVWRTTDQPPVTHTDRGLNDSVNFTWSVTGTKTITVTATNAGGSFTQTHQVTVWSSSVDIAGPTAGVVQADYAFTATVNPSTSPQPVTYTWQATDQSPRSHPDLGLTDTVTFTWNTPGTKTIEITATNADGTLTNTYQVDIRYAAPAHVEVTGPVSGTVDNAYTFNAAVSPITATQPITYTWQATDQASVAHTGAGLDDSVNFTWGITGTKTITVTATNAGGAVTNSYSVTIHEASQRTVYLPLVIRNR